MTAHCTTSDSARYAFGLGYANGPFSIGTTYDHVNGNTVVATGNRNQTTTVHLGTAYQLTGDVALKAGYRSYKLVAGAAATSDVRADMYWGGVNYQATPAIGLTGVVYYQDVKDVASGTDADPVMYVFRAKYALSKRTDLYAATAYAKAKNNQLVGLTRDSTADGGQRFRQQPNWPDRRHAASLLIIRLALFRQSLKGACQFLA